VPNVHNDFPFFHDGQAIPRIQYLAESGDYPDKGDKLLSSLNLVLKTEQRPFSCLALYGYDRYNSTL